MFWLPLGALCALGWFFLRSAPAPEGAARVNDDAAISSPDTIARPRSAQRSAPRGGPRLAATPDRPTPSDRIHPLMERVLNDHPELSQYHWLTRKVLPTADQRRMLEEMLSDPEMIQTAKMDLLASSETVYTREEEAKRMLQVEFLTDAMSWSENPEIETVFETIEDVLLAENISADASEELAQSLAGDKMDLYTQVMHSAPERAKTIAEHASGKPVEPLLSYSSKWYTREMLAMRADEHP